MSSTITAPALGTALNPDVKVSGVPSLAPSSTSAPDSTTMVSMIAPDGTSGKVPSNRVADAVRAGGKVAIKFVAPDGTTGVIPMDRVHDAIQAGGHIDDGMADALSSGVTGAASGVANGVAKGAVGTMRGVSDLVGDVIGAKNPLNVPDVAAPSGIAEHIGAGGEAVLEFMLGDEALKGLSMGEKLAKVAPAVRTLEQYPRLAKLVGATVRGATVGGAQGAVKGAATGNVVGGAETGAALGAAGGAASEGASQLLSGAGEAENAFDSPSKPGIVKQIIEGKNVAQPGAQQAVRQGVQAATENAGTADESLAANIQNQPLLQGNQTVLDEHLASLRGLESDAYERMDEAAGFDVKAEKAQLANDQYKLKQLGNTEADVALKDKLTQSIQDSQARIADAEKSMTDAGVDPKEADAIHKQRMAGTDFRKALVQNTSSDGQSVNVDGLLQASKNLRFSKYGDRLQQFFGSPEAADSFMSNLQQAQKAGQRAVKARQIAAWTVGLLGATGIGADIVKHVLPE